MSDLAYFALMRPEESYLVEVKTHNPLNGQLFRQREMEDIANECLALILGVRSDLKVDPISESTAKVFKKVKEILKRPDGIVYRVE